MLNYPWGLAADAAGNVYIADESNNRIRKVSLGGTITTIAGNGIASYFGDGGPATTSPLNTPVGLAIDTAGNLYFSDYYNHRIRKIAADGTISTVAGNGSAGFSGDGGPAIYARLYYPVGVSFDAAGNLYIADQYNHRIRKVDTNGIIRTIAGDGTATFDGDGTLATNASLYYPNYVAIAPDGKIYISDRLEQPHPAGAVAAVQ